MDARRAYLDSLGIRYYVPRFVLPGARASVAAPVVEEAAPAVAHVDIVLPQSMPAEPGATSVQQLQPVAARLKPDFAELGLAESKVPTPPQQAAGTEPEQAVTFKASLVDTGIGLLMVAPVDGQQLDPAGKRLMANIARACAQHCGRAADLSFSASDFIWPMHNIAAIRQDLPAAREAFSASVLARIEARPGRVLLVFGETLTSYLDAPLLQQHQIVMVGAAPLPELQQRPDAKASLWQALKALGAELAKA